MPSAEATASSRRGRGNDPDRRDRIIDACLDVIAESGIAGASHRRIAEAAGVPLGSMTYHFDGIDELYHEAFTRFTAAISAGFERRMAAATDAKSARDAVVAIIVDDVFGNARDLVITHELYTLAARQPSYRTLTAAWMARSRAALERWFDPETTRLLDALVEGLTIHRSLDAEPHDPSEIVRAVARVTQPGPARTLPPLVLEPEEPAADRWRQTQLDELVDRLRTTAAAQRTRPLVVAIDGRSASGKTTLADRLSSRLPDTTVVRTDDLAWHEPLFGWAHLLRDEVLRPAAQGAAVSFAPPAWAARGRPGTIDVPATTKILLVEGVGAADAAVADLVDLIVWVQADRDAARSRGLERDLASGANGDRAQTLAFWSAWYDAERAHLAADRPWERADVVVLGTPPPDAPEDVLHVADRLPPAATSVDEVRRD